MKFAKAYISATTACNFRCQHCLLKEERRKLKPKHIDLQLVQQFLFDFSNPKYAGFKDINITGYGNPLLHPELSQLLAMLRNACSNELSINCRGEIPHELLAQLKLHRVVVYYSMDWWGKKADEQMGSEGLWEKQLQTLYKLINMQIPVVVRTTIMRNNLADCLQFIAFVKELRRKGANVEWHGMPYLPYNDISKLPTQQQMELLTSICLSNDIDVTVGIAAGGGTGTFKARHGMRIVSPYFTCIYPVFRNRASRWWGKQRICEAGREGGRICLTQDGDVLPCPFEMQPIGKYELVNGRWNIDMVQFSARLREYLNKPLPTYCVDCLLKDTCKGGCLVHQRLSKECYCPKNLW